MTRHSRNQLPAGNETPGGLISVYAVAKMSVNFWEPAKNGHDEMGVFHPFLEARCDATTGTTRTASGLGTAGKRIAPRVRRHNRQQLVDLRAAAFGANRLRRAVNEQ